jgi:hypothetical protein
MQDTTAGDVPALHRQTPYTRLSSYKVLVRFIGKQQGLTRAEHH